VRAPSKCAATVKLTVNVNPVVVIVVASVPMEALDKNSVDVDIDVFSSALDVDAVSV